MPSENKKPAATEVAALIRKELGHELNSRFLRGLKVFSAEKELPEGFHQLLLRLDEAEARSR